MKKNYCSLTAYCRYIICMLLIFLWLATDSSAQVIKHFDFKDEQPFNTLTSVSQDSIGAIWLGSDSGIFYFDGYELLSFDFSMSSRPYVNFLYSDKGSLYIGTNEGLYVRSNSKGDCLLCSPILKSRNIIAYSQVSDLCVVATDRDVFLFDRQWSLVQKIPIYSENLSNHVTCLEVFNDRDLLLGTEAGLVWIRIENRSVGEKKTYYSGHKIVKLFIDSHNRLWMCKGEEVLCGELDCENFSASLLKQKHITYNHEVISFLEVNEQIWIGTRGYGISIYGVGDGGQLESKGKLYVDRSGDDELKNTVNAMFRDKMSRVWLCTLDGLYLYGEEYSNFHLIRHVNSERNTLSSNIISSIYCDEYNDLWLATSNGINRVLWKSKDDYFIEKYIDDRNVNDLMAGNKMQCITRIDKHLFLISTKNNIKFFDLKKKTFRDDLSLNRTLDQYGMRYVRSVFKDTQNNIWLAFSEGGVGYIHAVDGKFRRLKFPEKIKDKHRALCRDGQGNLWLASDNRGLYCMTLNENLEVISTKLYPKSEFVESWITALYIDHQKRLWAGTSNGLYRLNSETDKFQAINFPYSRKNPYIGGIIQDKMENIWAVGLHGIYKINFEDLVVYYELNANQPIAKTWYILGIAVNREGKIFVGGVNGLNYFNPLELSPSNDSQTIHISNVKVATERRTKVNSINWAQDVNRTGHLTLAYDYKQVSVCFSSLYYNDPMKIEYAYKLDGYDKDWIKTEPLKNYAVYSDLKPGVYVFKVKSTNSSGIWLDNVRSVRIEVKRAPWLTWWAYMLYTLGMIGILLLVTKVFNLSAKLKHRDALSKWKLNYYTHLSYGLKVPLTLIYAPLQYILKNFEQMSETDIKRMLKTMSKNVFNLSEQVNRLSEFKKVSLGEYDVQLSEVDGVVVIQEVCRLFLDEFENKHITETIEGNVTSVKMVVDVTKIEVAIYNIMEDAVEFAHGGGSIDIRYSVDSSDYRFKLVITAVRGGDIVLENKKWDTRFLIASDYLKIHHGELFVDSTDIDRIKVYTIVLLLGTSHYSLNELVTLDKDKPVSMLPLVPILGKDKAYARVEVSSDMLPLICLYEGDKEMALFIKSVFQSEYNVMLASASVWVKQLASKSPVLVIFDIVKEDDYKFNICKEVKACRSLSSIPVVFISSLTSDDTEQKAYEVGADIFMTKPFTVSQLETRIRQLLSVRATIKDNIRKELIMNPNEVLITSDDDKFLANVINVIEENMTDVDFNIDKLATELNISRSTLYRRMMEITELSPGDWIKSRRMQRAAELLEKTEYTVTEICDKVGYADQRYFGQCFKKEYGITPKKYSILKKRT